MKQNERRSCSSDEIDFQGNSPQSSLKGIRSMKHEEFLKQVLEQLIKLEDKQRLQSILSKKSPQEQEQILKSINLPDNEVDQHLLILVFDIQQYPHPPEPEDLQQESAKKELSPEDRRKKALRNYLMTHLSNAIQESGKLFVQGRYNYPPEVYNEAWKETLLYVWRNVHRYNPNEGLVMTWVNANLQYRFRDARDKYLQEQERKKGETSLDALLKNPNSGDESKETSIDKFLPPEERLFLSEQVYEYIGEDPTGLFQYTHIGDNIEANLQTIRLRMRTETVRSIAADFQLEEQRVYSFISRSLSRLGLIIEIDIKYLELVCEYIKRDSEGLFKQSYIKDYPHANFQELMLRILNRENFRKIAKDWQISEKTVYKFIKDSLKKFAPMIRKYIKEHQNQKGG